MHSVGFTLRAEMSLHEADREDLFAECTALVRRIELMVSGQPEPIVAGCRPSGAWSIYFGSDPAYHFDEQGRLRRAFAGGVLYRTQGNTLARLERQRTDEEVALLRTDLQPTDLQEFMLRLKRQVSDLQAQLSTEAAKGRRSHPPDVDVVALLARAVEQVMSVWPELSPAIPTRRG